MRNRRLPVISVSLALVLVGAFGVTACDDDDDDLEDVIDDRLDDLDIDDDLVITRTEWNNGFVAFDDDNDTVLIFSEFRFNGALFNLADLNHDNYVTQGEWNDVLDDIDTSDDGEIQESELAAYF